MVRFFWRAVLVAVPLLSNMVAMMSEDIYWDAYASASTPITCMVAQPETRNPGPLRALSRSPQKALCGGIPDPYLELLTRCWSHFVGVYRQILTTSLKN